MIETPSRWSGLSAGRLQLCLVVALALLAGACGGDDAAGSASTDIFVVGLSDEAGTWRAGPPQRVTDRDGYDNQPAFTLDGLSVLFSSRHGSQTDIFTYDLADRRLRRLTRTLESEYSPAPRPGDSRFSVVRVERDGRQRVWAFGESPDLTELLLARPEYVGYHAWVDRETVVVTVLGQPPTLHRVDLADGRVSDALAEDVGRSLQRVPGRNAVSFVVRKAGAAGLADGSGATDGEGWIHELDLTTGEQRAVVATLPGAEDHVWLPDGSVLMAQDSVLWRWGPGTLGLWAEVADYTGEGIESITRLALDPAGRRLAFVAEH